MMAQVAACDGHRFDEQRRRQRARNRAVLAGRCSLLVALFYVISIVRMSGG